VPKSPLCLFKAHGLFVINPQETPMNETVVQSILFVAAIFAMLPGVALLVSAITGVIKAVSAWVGHPLDGFSDQIAAWLNLAAFIALVLFRAFVPNTPFEIIDAQAQDIANALIALAFFFGQLQLQPIAYSALRGRLPLVGFSFNSK
jgi:hypothetical protein